MAVVMRTLVLAGTLHLSYRDVSRLLSICSASFDLVAVVALRLVVCFVSRIAGGKIASTKVLTIRARRVEKEVARVIKGQEWSCLRAIGHLDDDPKKMGTNPAGVPVLGVLAKASQGIQDEQLDEVILALPLRAHGKMVPFLRGHVSKG